MTYSDIYTKFLIEYDKQNITSSYPSLTVYEIATLLDKAYLALIAQKLTGNNPRRAPFEIDIKAIEDLRPLITTTSISEDTNQNYSAASNIKVYKLPIDDGFLYYVSSTIDNEESIVYPRADINKDGTVDWLDRDALYNAMQNGGKLDPKYHGREDINEDGEINSDDVIELNQQFGETSTNPSIYKRSTKDPITLINHAQLDKFIASSVNIPWIKTPVGCLEGDFIYILYDPFDYQANKVYGNLNLTYIKRPKPFVGEDDNTTNFTNGTEFELNDTMAEELINLAIVMALETVESPRIQTKEQTRALES